MKKYLTLLTLAFLTTGVLSAGMGSSSKCSTCGTADSSCDTSSKSSDDQKCKDMNKMQKNNNSDMKKDQS